MNGHLFDGDERHMRDCATCRAEQAAFDAGLAAFARSVRSWAAQQPHPPNPLIRTTRRSAHAFRPWLLAAIAVVAAVLLPIRWISVARREAAWRENAILLERVNTQLSRTVPATMQPLMDLMQEGMEDPQ